MISARPEVEALSPYRAPLEGRRGKLRLDFNENTLGPSPRVMEAIRALTQDAYATYPEYAELNRMLAGYVGVAENQLALFNGADAALKAVFDAFARKGDRFVTTTPTFGYYQPCADLAGMETCAVAYDADLSFPWDALESALQQPTRLCILCNPNNPTTTLVRAERILECAGQFPDTLFVVDEIYEAYTGVTVLPRSTESPNVLALRSFSKSFGLAALRLGFIAGPARLVDFCSRVTGPYDINAFSIVAAEAALGDPGHVETYVQEVKRAREWTLESLSQLGLRYFSQGGNYALVWPSRPVADVEAALRARGILVRSQNDKPLLEGSFRLSIGTVPQMQRVIRELTDILAG